MKPYYALPLCLISALIYGCKSDGVSPSSLKGKWKLVSDSTSYNIGPAKPTVKNYQGLAGDYFDFRADGYCYTKEGSVYDTLAYQPSGSKQVIIADFGMNLNGKWSASTIEAEGSSRIGITSPELLTPGGTAYRKVILSK